MPETTVPPPAPDWKSRWAASFIPLEVWACAGLATLLLHFAAMDKLHSRFALWDDRKEHAARAIDWVNLHPAVVGTAVAVVPVLWLAACALTFRPRRIWVGIAFLATPFLWHARQAMTLFSGLLAPP